MKKESTEKHVVRIERLAFGGSGVGRLPDGLVCFIPFTAPGDTIRMEVVRRKKSFCEGRLLEVRDPSPIRVSPPCPVYGKCGGCHLQHLPYEAQLEAKGEIFSSMIVRAVGVSPAAVAPAPDPFNYRSRIQLKLHFDGERFHRGFFARDSHFVVDFGPGCPIASPAVNRGVRDLDAVLAGFPDPRRLPQVDIASADGEALTFIFHYIGGMLPEVRDYLAGAVHLLPVARGIFIQQGRKSTLEPVLDGGHLRYSIPSAGGRMMEAGFGAGCFSQVNLPQNRAIVAQALGWGELKGDESVLDLFCGNGNFSLPLAVSAGRIEGCEAYAPSIEDAVANAAANGIGNAAFHAVESESFLRTLIGEGREFELVVLDPPRAGAAAECRLIPHLRPRRIVYVSCDPPTLARDLGILAAGGYRVAASRPFDMFPQTYHIESITLLERA